MSTKTAKQITKAVNTIAQISPFEMGVFKYIAHNPIKTHKKAYRQTWNVTNFSEAADGSFCWQLLKSCFNTPELLVNSMSSLVSWMLGKLGLFSVYL